VGPVLSLLFLGCAPVDEVATGCGARAEVRDDVPTILTVRWRTPEPTVGHVEFGATEALGLATPTESEPTTEHVHTLLGLAADTEVYYRVFDESCESPVATMANGSLPSELPNIETSGDGGLGSFVVTVLEGALWGPVILDASGNIVWWDVATEDFAVTRAYLTDDRRAVLYNESNDRSRDYAAMEEAYVVRVPLDGSGAERIPLPYLSHDFAALPSGEVVGIARELREVDGVEYLGDRLTELAPDGSLVDRWSAFDHFDPAEVGGVDAARGTWTHANAVDYEPGTDSFLLGLRNFSSIIRVSRQTGEISWAFGGLVGDQLPEGIDSALDLYHQFELVDGSLLAFDNGSPERGYSRVVEYEVGDGTGPVTQTWSWVEDPPSYVAILGDAQRVGDGSIVSSLSLEGQLVRVSREGEVSFRAATSLGYGFGYAQLVDSLY